MVTYFFYYQLKKILTKLLAQLRGNLLYYLIKEICLDNVDEFTSHAFNEYYISSKYKLQVPKPILHFKN